MAESKNNKQYEIENREWLESLRYVLKNEPEERVQELLGLLKVEAQKHGISFSQAFNTPYINTFPHPLSGIILFPE